MTAHSGANTLRAGTRLERYIIRSVLGVGGFGVTYLAEHELLGKLFAIKEHFPSQFATRDSASGRLTPTDAETYAWALDRFLQEARVLARCKHTNIVAVTATASDNAQAATDMLAATAGLTEKARELDALRAEIETFMRN